MTTSVAARATFPLPALPAVVALLATLAGWTPGANAEEIRIATTATVSSFGAANRETGLSGFNVDMANEICRRMGATCTFVETHFPDVIPGVARGDFEIGVANTLKTPERAKQVLFSTPYWRSTSSFVGRRGVALPDLSALLVEKRVCTIRATRQEAFLTGLPGATDKSVVASGTNQETMSFLKSGACDMALVPTMQSLPFLQSSDGAGFAFLGLPMIDDGLGGDVHMIVTPGRPDLLEKLNAALTAIIRDGTHDKISRRYFPFSIL